MPLEISLEKKYKTKSGLTVKLFTDESCIHTGYFFYGEVSDADGNTTSSYWDNQGKSVSMFDHMQLVEVQPWDSWEIDQRVYVKVKISKDHPGSRYLQRHFAGVSVDGKPCIFGEGRSSWTIAEGATIGHGIIAIPSSHSMFYWESLSLEVPPESTSSTLG